MALSDDFCLAKSVLGQGAATVGCQGDVVRAPGSSRCPRRPTPEVDELDTIAAGATRVSNGFRRLGGNFDRTLIRPAPFIA